MNDIRQERPSESPILKLNEKLKQMLLNNKIGTHVKKSMVSKAVKKQTVWHCQK